MTDASLFSIEVRCSSTPDTPHLKSDDDTLVPTTKQPALRGTFVSLSQKGNAASRVCLEDGGWRALIANPNFEQTIISDNFAAIGRVYTERAPLVVSTQGFSNRNH